MRIRTQLLQEAMQIKETKYVLSFALYLKHILDGGQINNVNMKKIADLTGLDAHTCSKYYKHMLSSGFAFLDKDGKTLVIRNLSSGDNIRNTDLSKIDFSSLTTVRNGLECAALVAVIKKKEFVAEKVREASFPRKGEDPRKARRWCKKHNVPQDPDTAKYYYRECGISFQTIKKIMGCSLVHAFQMVKYACHLGMIKIYKPQAQYYAPSVNFYTPVWATFSTFNNIYVVSANVYHTAEYAEDNLSAIVAQISSRYPDSAHLLCYAVTSHAAGWRSAGQPVSWYYGHHNPRFRHGPSVAEAPREALSDGDIFRLYFFTSTVRHQQKQAA